MSSMLRDTAEHIGPSIRDLVSEAMQHIVSPHVDLECVAGRRRSLSPTSSAAIVAVVVLVAVVATRAVRGLQRTPVLDKVIAGPSTKGKKTSVAA